MKLTLKVTPQGFNFTTEQKSSVSPKPVEKHTLHIYQGRGSVCRHLSFYDPVKLVTGYLP